MAVQWTTTTATMTLADAHGLIVAGYGVDVTYALLQQSLSDGLGPKPSEDAAARACAMYHATNGDANPFGVAWTGTCPTLASEVAEVFISGSGAVLSTQIRTTGGNSLFADTFAAEVSKSCTAFTVESDNADLMAWMNGQAGGGSNEFDVQAVSVALTLAAASTSGTTDWMGMVRTTTNPDPDRAFHWIKPNELFSYPLVTTLSPGGSMSLTVQLTPTVSPPWSVGFFRMLYLSSDLSERGAQDLGMVSNRFGSWLVQPTAMTVTFRHRPIPIAPSISEGDREAIVHFEP